VFSLNLAESLRSVITAYISFSQPQQPSYGEFRDPTCLYSRFQITAEQNFMAKLKEIMHHSQDCYRAVICNL